MKKILLVLTLFAAGISAVKAQIPSPSQAKQMTVEELTDGQVLQIVEEMKKNHVTLYEMDGFARQKGIPASEVSALKDRIRTLNLDKELKYTAPPESLQTGRGINMENMTYESAGRTQVINDGRKRMYGAELFSNRNLTFEPNLKMPTPPNYKLATGDELMIDVYGYSEIQFKLPVTPEGYIRIPNLGPVYVNGLTIEEAKKRITQQLSTIYGGIKSGNTFVQVSLGSIRSIKVLMIGDIERPGTYTLPSLASIANALYVSGGPNDNGSFRDIQVIRNGSVVARFDLYEFLQKGDLSDNIILQDQDIVKVDPYKVRVELEGQVKRPAIFEAREGETLETIIGYAGGYTDRAYRDVIRASRINAKERQILTITSDEVSGFSLRSGDRFFVDAILDRFSNRVSITGAVFHPGDYALEDNMTLSSLIKKADGLMEVASYSRGIIRRMKEDYTPAIINFNLDEIVKGQNDIRLQREDSVIIFSKVQLKENFQVKIDGLVNNPGYFPYADSMHLEDLVLLAGGLREAASLKRVEVSRRIRDNNSNGSDTLMSIIQYFDIRADLRSTPDASGFVLQPFDEVSIRKSPSYSEQASVSITGEVNYPGGYTILSKKEKISDLLRRAGGLKSDAYPEGAVLLRPTYVNESDSALMALKLDVFVSKLGDSSAISRVQSAVRRQQQLLGIDLTEVLKRPGSKFDLLLEEGDIVKIPKKLQTVQLLGEIYFPKKVRFDKGLRFKDYIRHAGGFTNHALKRRSYIVYANGEVKSSKRVLFFNAFPKVKPGSEIYVPKKGEKRSVSATEAISMTTGLASIALIIITLLNRNN